MSLRAHVAKQSPYYEEIASGKEQERPRNDMIKPQRHNHSHVAARVAYFHPKQSPNYEIASSGKAPPRNDMKYTATTYETGEMTC